MLLTSCAMTFCSIHHALPFLTHIVLFGTNKHDTRYCTITVHYKIRTSRASLQLPSFPTRRRLHSQSTIKPTPLAMTETSVPRLSPSELQNLETRLSLPLRPGTGAAGKGIRLYSNYFQVTGLPVGEIVQYDVVIEPEVPRGLRRY